MYPYIVCSCGRSIGDLYDLYLEMKNEKIEASADVEIDPLLLAITDSVSIDMSDVLDDLGLHVECCRTRITTLVQFKDLY